MSHLHLLPRDRTHRPARGFSLLSRASFSPLRVKVVFTHEYALGVGFGPILARILALEQLRAIIAVELVFAPCFCRALWLIERKVSDRECAVAAHAFLRIVRRDIHVHLREIVLRFGNERKAPAFNESLEARACSFGLASCLRHDALTISATGNPLPHQWSALSWRAIGQGRAT